MSTCYKKKTKREFRVFVGRWVLPGVRTNIDDSKKTHWILPINVYNAWKVFVNINCLQCIFYQHIKKIKYDLPQYRFLLGKLIFLIENFFYFFCTLFSTVSSDVSEMLNRIKNIHVTFEVAIKFLYLIKKVWFSAYIAQK